MKKSFNNLLYKTVISQSKNANQNTSNQYFNC